MRLHATVLSSIDEAYVFNSTKAVLNLAWSAPVNSCNCPSDARLYGQSPHATTDLALHYYRGARVPEMAVPPPQRSTL
jgi:hypothetical protein